MKTLLRCFLISFIMLPYALSAQAPLDLLKQDVSEALDLLYTGTAGEELATREAKVRAVLEKRFAFPAISQRSLGVGWKRINEKQQAQFTEAFTQLLIRSYTSRFIGADKPELTYGDPIDLGSTRVEIPVDVTLDGNRYKIAYRMADIEGKPMVYDIIIENVSLVSNYRQQFSDILNRKGMDAVFKALADKLEHPDPE